MCLFLPFLTCLIVLFLMFILFLFISLLASFLLLTNDLIFRQRFIHLRLHIVSFESPGVLEPSGGTIPAMFIQCLYIYINIVVHLLLFILIYLHTYIMIFNILFIVGHV